MELSQRLKHAAWHNFVSIPVEKSWTSCKSKFPKGTSLLLAFKISAVNGQLVNYLKMQPRASLIPFVACLITKDTCTIFKNRTKLEAYQSIQFNFSGLWTHAKKWQFQKLLLCISLSLSTPRTAHPFQYLVFKLTAVWLHY